MSELNLEEIEARWDEATEGPWVFQPWSAHLLPSGDYAESILMTNASSDGELCRGLFDADGEAIAHARQDVPALIAEVRRLRESLELHEQGLLKELTQASMFTAQAIGSVPTIVAEKMLTIGYSGLVAQRGELEAQIERVRGLHKRAHAVGTRTGLRYEEPCPDCDGKAGTHDCGCWSDFDTVFVCAECHRLGSGTRGVYDYTYPCPTIQALDAPAQVASKGDRQ